MTPRAASGGCSARTTRGPTGSTAALRSAPFTDGLEDFDPALLRPARGPARGRRGARPARPVRRRAAAAGRTSATSRRSLAAVPARRSCERGARIVYDVDANWKAIAENYSECLHCPGVHPELNRLSHYLSRRDDRGRGRVVRRLDDARRGRRDDGRRRRAHGRKPIDGVDLRSILYFLIFPNTLVSLHPDYVMLHTLWPQAPDRTEVVCEWFFEPERSPRADFDPTDAVGFWDQVNREDWNVCELTQRGMASRVVHARPLHDAGGRRARVRRDGRRRATSERSAGDDHGDGSSTRSSSAAATTG